MDRILSELFGGDEPEAGADTRSDTADKPADRSGRPVTRRASGARPMPRPGVAARSLSSATRLATLLRVSPREEAIAYLREMRDEMNPGRSFAAPCSAPSSISRPASATISSRSCASTRPARPSRRPAPP